MFWFAIQTLNGGDVVYVMITAIWPSFADLHNDIPASEGITTAQMVSFLLCQSSSSPRSCCRELTAKCSLARPNTFPLHAP